MAAAGAEPDEKVESWVSQRTIDKETQVPRANGLESHHPSARLRFISWIKGRVDRRVAETTQTSLSHNQCNTIPTCEHSSCGTL